MNLVVLDMEQHDFTSNCQLLLFSEQFPENRRGRPTPEQYEALARVRLSKHYILRDFLFSTECAARGLSNYPEDPDMVIRAGKALCEKLLEPIRERWGHVITTFGYQSREDIEWGWSKGRREANRHSSSPHMWDRKCWGEAIYARCDILPICVEDGEVSKHEFGHWLMHSLDLDLCMMWRRSNVFCLTISPRPRRVWVLWGNPQIGEPKQEMLMGATYWREVYPYLPEDQRPKFGPSCTGGRMQWRE